MFKSIIAALLVTATITAQAAPIFVRNGAGRSEYSLIFSHLHLADLLSVCADGRCALSAQARTLLDELLRRAVSAPVPVFTQTESDFNGAFLVDSKNKTVTFKPSTLWKDREMSQALDVNDSVLVWLDVLASIRPLNLQALPELKAALLTALNAKVLRTLVQISPISSFEALSLKKSAAGDLLYVRDASLVSHDLTPALSAATDCRQSAEKLEIKSLRWGSVPPSSDAGDLRVPLEATASWTCEGRVHRSRFRLVLVSFANDQGLEVIDPSQTRIFGQGE